MGKRKRNWVLAAGVVAVLAGSIGISAYAEPRNGQVVGGSATIQGTGTGNLTIDQSSQRAIINWQSFNIAPGESTRFVQPNAASVALNRVTGDKSPSQIFGALSANGQVFLVNPEGFVFGPSATINTAGFLATTHDIKSSDFLAGKYNFSISGNPTASIINQGTITVTDAGIAALVAPGVRNDGVISARLGRVGLASANAFTLDFYGDNLIKFNVSDAIAGQIIDPITGQPLKSLIANRGTLSATGGIVAMTAVTARAIVDDVINNSGVIEARTAGVSNGQIVLGAPTARTKASGAPKQSVVVAGTLDVSGAGKGETGGGVEITGETIGLKGANIVASGDDGGGKVLIGGDTGGGKPSPSAAAIPTAALESRAVATATTVTADASTSIKASAITSGDGGKVIVWADGSTSFLGAIAARGGALGGNGGFAEVSGHGTLAYDGTANLGSTTGLSGTLLLDPKDVTIGTSGTWIVTPASIQAALATNNVVVTTSAAGTDAGDISVAQNVGWSSANTLTLSANRNITVMPGVTISNTGAGSLVLRADNTGSGTGMVFNGSGKVDFSGSTGLVSIFYDPTGTLKYQNRVNYNSMVLTNPLLPKQFNSYTLVNSLSDIQSISQNFSGKYALGTNIAAGGAVIAPIGDQNHLFTGIFDGLGHTIDGLQINGTGIYVGLFADVCTCGIIRDVGLTNLAVTAPFGYEVGGLAGRNHGSISGSYTTGSVNGTAGNTIPGLTGVAVGGLTGWNFGTISQSYSAASVSSPTTAHVSIGGLSGGNNGSILQSYATGTVTGHSGAYGAGLVSLGGLVGWNEVGGTISQSYATGNANGSGSNTAAGGLVGYMNGGAISYSYATGTAVVGSPGWAGGLVGVQYNGTISQSYATGSATAGDFGDAGGLVGEMDGGSIFQAYASGNSNAGISADAGGLVGHTYGGTINQTYATGRVSIVLAAPYFDSWGGGIAGENSGAAITNSYWNTQTTGQSVGVGRSFSPGSSTALGLTTSQFSSGLPSGLSPSVWSQGATYPFIAGIGAIPARPNPTAINLTGAAPPSLLISDVYGQNLTRYLTTLPGLSVVIVTAHPSASV